MNKIQKKIKMKETESLGKEIEDTKDHQVEISKQTNNQLRRKLVNWKIVLRKSFRIKHKKYKLG